MLEFYVIVPEAEEALGIKKYLKNNGVDDNVEILAYIACNNGIRHGPTMGATWKRMEKEVLDKFGKDAKNYGAIMGSFSRVPESMKSKRIEITGCFGNEPFDMIVYKSLQPTD